MKKRTYGEQLLAITATTYLDVVTRSLIDQPCVSCGATVERDADCGFHFDDDLRVTGVIHEGCDDGLGDEEVES